MVGGGNGWRMKRVVGAAEMQVGGTIDNAGLRLLPGNHSKGNQQSISETRLVHPVLSWIPFPF